MAKDLYNGKLNSFMDFAAAGPHGEPASGYAVQNYIKDKIGVGYYDADTARHLFFKDDVARDAWIEDPTRTDLIVDEIQMEALYKMEATLIDPAGGYTAVFYGSTGNYIRFTFITKNKDDQPFAESVNVIYTIQHSGTITTVNESYHAGATANFNIDKYLHEGTNEILITIKGQISKASTTIGATFDAVNLSLSDDFDTTTIYTNQDNLTVAFDYAGSGVKYLEWYIDGNKLPYDAHTDNYIAVQGSGVKTIPLSGMASGRHNLQYRIYVETSNGVRFYSDVLYRDFIINDDNLTGTTILTKFSIPQNIGIIDAFTQPIPLHGPVQYEEYTIGYSIYSKTNKASYPMTITLGQSESSYELRNRTAYEYVIRSYTDTTTPLEFSCDNTTLTFNAYIETSSYDLHQITGTVFEFSGSDRTNSSEDRDDWSFAGWAGELNGFDWNENSGWSNGRLVIPDGASFVTDYAPFANDIKGTGFTFGIEFETARVLDETTPVLDLTNNGNGLLITTSEISFITSSTATGTTLATRYKPEENIRIDVVVYPLNTGAHPGMMFIYVDGIMTGAADYAASDSFISPKTIEFIGTDDANVRVKQIRCYPRALTDNEVLNNFILYQDTVEDLVSAYDRNDVYVENTERMSDNKLAARTPIIVITGDVDRLQHFTKDDKGTYVRMDKIEVINYQDPTKNMTLINPSMRCQGTSSMAYPRKNFRFYTQADNKDETQPRYTTQMYDWEGNELTGDDRLYSFKDGAQPVKTWCLKADYAESSSTHNTGVARMWNNYMKNARLNVNDVDDRFYLKSTFVGSGAETIAPGKTMAQFCAEQEDYEYDVRTTVDGFPITLFYHEHEGDPLIFLGKYNWNNDKSTESVFGFKSIPGFDNSHMECWEVVNGDYPCNLFTDVSHWTSTDHDGWRYSFEARYPDDSGKPSEAERAEGPNSALKRVATWINSTMGASKVQDGKMVKDNDTLWNKFKSEKWNYLDVYKVAAYYVYLMRFGAVDQTVKNAMFTTEDGLHWYYINYDNDTINGVRNDGALKFGYNIDRQSKDPDNPAAYCYAGHDSVLWNNLESDDEFMEIVRKMDGAIYNAGMSYANVIDMFNIKQSASWAERTHNEDYKYKYINISDKTQLAKLQGPRKSHRQWWLSHRFANYDAINGTDAYLGNRVEIKPFGGDPTPNDIITVIPAVNGQIFGYGLERPMVLGVEGQEDVPIDFTMTERYYIGTTIKVYNAVYFKELDLSKISQQIDEINFGRVNTTAFDSNLTTLVLGTLSSQVNTGMTRLEGLANFKYLEDFQMVGYTGIGRVDLSENNYLKTVDVRNCTNLASIDLPHAAPLSTLMLPGLIQSLVLDNFFSLNTVTVQNNAANIHTIDITNCPNLTNDPTFFLNWLDNKTTPDADCSVYMDNIVWENIDIDDLHSIGEFILAADPEKTGKVTLLGHASVESIRSQEDVDFFINVFGPNVFDPSAAFYIVAPPAIYITGPTTVLEGSGSIQYTGVAVGIEDQDGYYTYRIATSGLRHDDQIGSDTGIYTSSETGGATQTIEIVCTYHRTGGGTISGRLEVEVQKRKYPSSSQISIDGPGQITLEEQNVYSVVYSTEGITGNMYAAWSLTGDIAQYASIVTYDNESCTVALLQEPAAGYVSGSVVLVLRKVVDDSYVTNQSNPPTKTFGYQDDTIAISRAVNPWAMDVVYNNLHSKGLCASYDKMLIEEAEQVLDSDIVATQNYSIFSYDNAFRDNCTNFDEFRHFTGLRTIPKGCFYGCTKLESVIIPNNIQTIEYNAFYNCSKLSSINIPSSVTTIKSYVFTSVGITSITIPSSVITLEAQAFQNCTGLTSVTMYCDVPSYCFSRTDSARFYNCANIRSITLGEGVTSIGQRAFYGYNNWLDWLDSITIPSTVTTIANQAFEGCTGLTDVIMYCDVPDNCFNISQTYSCFFNCPNIRNVTLGEGVINIGSRAFNVQQWLTSIIIPNSVITIGQDVFDGCTGLTSVTMGNSVTAIGNSAFSNCPNITSITLPSSVTSIGSSAFYGCTGLTSINIPSSVTTINNYTFQNCTGLTSINIPSSVTTINNRAFQNCTGLVSINIPSSVTTIVSGAFEGCTGLISITLPSSVTSMGGGVFRNCTGLTDVTMYCNIPSHCFDFDKSYSAFNGCENIESITLGEGIVDIGSNVFDGIDWIDTIVIPNSVTTIRQYAFQNCSGLTSITIGSSVTTIETSVFKNCPLLASITVDPSNPTFNDGSAADGHDCIIGTSNNILYCGCKNSVIPQGVVRINNYAFDECTGLTSINIPNTVTTIDYSAFYFCSNLASINIPSSVTSLQSNSFYGCYSVSSITVDYGNSTYYDGRNVGGSNCIIRKSNNYLYIGCKNSVIPQGVLNIGNGAFYGCTGLTSITLPSSITSIGSNAFQNCTGLTSINIPIACTSIMYEAFAGCTSLSSITVDSSNTVYNDGSSNGGHDCIIGTSTNILYFGCKNSVIPNTVTSIDSYAFEGCTGLTSINIPNSVTTIRQYAFQNCSGLNSITLPSSITSISSGAFYSCTGLVEVTICCDIPNNCFRIDSSNAVFYQCSSIERVILGEGVNIIGTYAFYEQTWLNSINIPNTVTTINNSVFYKCTGLTTIIIGNSVTTIGNSAFGDCTGLISVTIGSSVTSIGSNAFNGCSHLTTITSLPTTPPTIYPYTLPGTTVVQNIYVPSGSVIDYQTASNWNSYASIISAIA